MKEHNDEEEEINKKQHWLQQFHIYVFTSLKNPVEKLSQLCFLTGVIPRKTLSPTTLW